MGVYNIFGENNIQLKVESYEKLQLKHYKIGDEVELGDGIYVGYEGIVVIVDGIFIAEFLGIFDKWGGFAGSGTLINNKNPVNKIVEETLKATDIYRFPHKIEEDEYGEEDEK